MKACARIVAEPDGRGGTRLTELYGEAPLLPRRTGPAQVHLVGGAAGPLGGDRLRLDVRVCPGASLTVHTVAATLALPGPGLSTLDIHVRVGQGATLRWLPEPLVAAAGCHHRTVSTVELDHGAELVWREEIVAGRFGEEPGELTAALRVRLDGVPLLAQELAVGPGATGWAGAAVLGGARATGSLLVVDAAPPPVGSGTSPECSWATMPLADPAGVITTAVATDARALRTSLDRAWTPSSRGNRATLIDSTSQ